MSTRVAEIEREGETLAIALVTLFIIARAGIFVD
jgi:hypothetical protein